LESGDDDITQNALLGLAIIADKNTPLEPVLPIMTQHHNPQVRSNAALCLSSIVQPKDTDAVMPYVLPALRDDDPKVRNHAILIVYEIKDEGAISLMIDLMKDHYPTIRVNAARALGELGDIYACPALIENLDHSKEAVRFYCLESLRKLTGEDYGDDKEKWIEWWKEYSGQ
jgi:HEAT repeat protein